MTAALALQHFELSIPLRVVSVANSREHWAARRKRESAQRHAVECTLLARMNRGELPRKPPPMVTFVRVGPRQLDTDNLAIAFKHLRDLVAELYGVDDSPSGPITWAYEQRTGKYGIVIRITAPPQTPELASDRSRP